MVIPHSRPFLLAATLASAAPAVAAAQIRLEASLAVGPAAFTDRKLGGGLRNGLEIQGAVQARLGAVALGVEAGTVGTSREPGTYGCIDPTCTAYGFSNYYTSRTSHVVLALRAGGRSLHRPYLTTGLGYYHVANSYEPPARALSLEGLGAHAGLGVGLAQLSGRLRFALEARWHTAIVAGSDDAGFVSFVTVTAGLQLR